jgi:hypothetical protein
VKPAAALLLLGACQPWRWPDAAVCDPFPPSPGTLVIGPLVCAEQVPEGGEGRAGSDLYVATPHYRAVLRHPQDALTLSGAGGLTLIDWAPWGGPDVLHEAVPLVRDGSLIVVDHTVGDDFLLVDGLVGSLPDRAVTEGEAARIVWRFDPDEPRLWVDGADGWFVHARGDVERVGRSLLLPGASLVAEGPVTDDLGGAVRTGLGGLWLDAPADVWSWRGEQAWTGHVDGSLELWAGDEPWGRVPGGDVQLSLPAAVTHGRAVGVGRAPRPQEELTAVDELQAGPMGTLDVRWSDDGPDWATVHWEHADGRRGSAVLASPGGGVPVGAGEVAIEPSAGARWTVDPQSVVLGADEVQAVELAWRERLPRAGWAAVTLDRPTDRSRTHRGTDRAVLDAVAADGFDYAALLAVDDTTAVDPEALGHPRLRVHGGTRVEGDGWRVEAWPVRPSDKKNAHGTLQYPVHDPVEALQLAAGGASRITNLRVDLPTLDALGAPHEADQPPHLVALEAPGDGLVDWAVWMRWLDAGRLVGPTGPVTWVPVPDPDLLTSAEVDAALRRGAVVASTGPRLQVTIDGLAPGDLAPLPSLATGDTGDTGTPAPPTVEVYVHDVSGGLDELLVLGAGGEILATLPPEAGATVEVAPARWMVVVGLGDTDWAVTGPIWVDPPR